MRAMKIEGQKRGNWRTYKMTVGFLWYIMSVANSSAQGETRKPGKYTAFRAYTAKKEQIETFGLCCKMCR